jgi:hypothetical protein
MLLSALLLAACGADPVDTAQSYELPGGRYRFYTVAVEDGCLDGALEALFMPEGPSERHSFEYLVYLPGQDELPATYEVDFRDPFVGMEVTVTEGEGGTLLMEGGVMESVTLGSRYGDCTATMIVDAALVPVGPEDAEGIARISVGDLRSSDSSCPVLSSDPCDVNLDIEAEYAE